MKLITLGAVLAVVLLHICLPTADAQAVRDNGLGGEELIEPVDPGTDEFNERITDDCTYPYRQMDGTCTNKHFKLWGSTGRPQFSYSYRKTSATPTGTDLPSPRLISNIICAQAGEKLSRRGINEFTTFMGQFIDHSIIVTPENHDEPMNIPIPRDDPIFGNFSNGELKFFRSVRGKAERATHLERPTNSLSSSLDLAGVYGSDPLRLTFLREFKDGLMKTSGKDMLPINVDGLVNAPASDNRFFLAGDHRANENPTLTALHTVFMREHNGIARNLKAHFPAKDDETLFQWARIINIAQFQKIVYEEFYPTMTGRHMRYSGYRATTDPTVSDLFVGSAFRVGHTMVSNKISRRAAGNRKLPDVPIETMFFRTRKVLNQGLELFLRGALYERSQEVDVFVVDALRNFLFTNVPQEIAFDLIATNIQRSRDHALPSYNEVRMMFRIRPARRWAHITTNRAVQNALHTAYGHPSKVEAWVGLMAEDHVPGASMGQTMLRIWEREFGRYMHGDRFYFRRMEMYPAEMVSGFPYLQKMLNEKDTMRGVLLRNTELKDSELHSILWRAQA